ncbi:MAG: hypothetical protein V2A73_07750, partial [Pseudomonadota bacterium]
RSRRHGVAPKQGWSPGEVPSMGRGGTPRGEGLDSRKARNALWLRPACRGELMKVPNHPLDPFLPLLPSDEPSVLADATILEVQDVAQLLELGRDPRIGRYLLARLSDTMALVDPGADESLVKALRAAGHTPKIEEGSES